MQRKGKIVIVSQYYPPDRSTTAAILSAIGEHLAIEAPVLVLSGTSGSALPGQTAQPSVVEIKNWMPGKAALIKRAAAEIFFTIRMFFALLTRLQREDVALTVTAPFMLPYAVVAAARLKRARSVLIMHDLFPDVLVVAGLLTSESLVAKTIRGLNALMFRALNSIVVIGHDTEHLLMRYGEATRDKISFIPNWATLTSGIHLPNVTLVERVAEEDLEDLLSAADIWVIPYRKNVAGVSIPSRFYNLLAVGRPVVLISESDADAAVTVTDNNLGWVVMPGRPDELAETFRLASLSKDPLMVERAVAVARSFSLERAMRSYANLTRGLLRDRNQPGHSS